MGKNKKFDVAIIGGGLAGLTLSCLLGQGGVSVACIDREAPGAAQGDLRTTAISYGSRQILERAGVWCLLAEAACPINDIRILDGSSPLLLNFLQSEVEGRSFGWIVENAALRAALLKTAIGFKSVSHIAPAQVQDFQIDEKSACVILADGKMIEAALIIGADGRNSFTREWMGVRTRQWSYRQQAIICTAAHEHPHNNMAVEHFWPSGPFAVLPMADAPDGQHRSAIVLTEHKGGESLMKLDGPAFEAALAAYFPAEYGTIKIIGKRVAYPLGLIHAAHYIGPRIALVADAAHAIHPIAGQGLNLGLRDVQELSGLMNAAKAAGTDIGAAVLLETYQRRRRPDNMAMVAVTDGLNRLFSNNITPVRLLRRAGLRVVSRIPAAKRFFMRQAMGDR